MLTEQIYLVKNTTFITANNKNEKTIPGLFKLIFTSCGISKQSISTSKPASDSGLKVMSYNIHIDAGTGGEPRVLATARIQLSKGKYIRFGSTHLDAQSKLISNIFAHNHTYNPLRNAFH